MRQVRTPHDHSQGPNIGALVLVTGPRGRCYAHILELDTWGAIPMALVRYQVNGVRAWVPAVNCVSPRT